MYGRGLLHLTVLIETMRREGFELMIGCPKVIEQEIEGARRELFEPECLVAPSGEGSPLRMRQQVRAV